MNKLPTIGLFGTCGGSKWRDKFIEDFNSREIKYFNPVKENWKPEDATEEAEHLANDEILLFPITNETYAFGSLAETGFSILQAIRLDVQRDIIVMIEPDVVLNHNLMTTNECVTAEAQRKDSIRARALVIAHLKKLKYPNVYIVKDLDNMLNLSLQLYNLQYLKNLAIERYTIK